MTALCDPVFGRPLVKSLAFGSSVPELDPDDLAALKVVRLESTEEFAIAELAEASSRARSAADLLEREIRGRCESYHRSLHRWCALPVADDIQNWQH